MAHFFEPASFGIEVVFTIFAVAFCFAIYYKTKEIYDLTKHKGLEYFRNAFLFFGLSYGIRFILGLVLFSRIAFDVLLPRKMFMFLFIPLSYFSTIGIFYLVLSTVWKRIDASKWVPFGHGVAATLSILTFLTRSHLILLALQFALLALAVILGTLVRKFDKKISGAKILYLLILSLWLMNLFILDKRSPVGTETMLYVISLGVLLAMYYKISKWT